MNTTPPHQIRAVFDASTITVYQAFRPEIARPAVAVGRFVPPFGMGRMTWIKPSFLWMMYRCGWATKPGQEHVLAIRMTRTGFEEALSEAALSHFDSSVHADKDAWRKQVSDSPVRVQWDPERTPSGAALPYRSLQVGLSGNAVQRYVDDWVVEIADITDDVRKWHPLAASDPSVLPQELPYPLPARIAARIGADTHSKE